MPLRHKGVEYSIKPGGPENPDFFQWQFQIGKKTVTGKTATKLEKLAERRTQIKIDEILRKIAREENP